jgi:hypothetical protein
MRRGVDWWNLSKAGDRSGEVRHFAYDIVAFPVGFRPTVLANNTQTSKERNPRRTRRNCASR